MIFAHTWEKVLSGEKTQTRRAVKPTHMVTEGIFISPALGRLIPGVSVPAVQSDPSWRDLWHVGHTYALQPGRGKTAVGRVEITEIRYCEQAAAISPEDAIAEGFATPDEFRDVYGRINGAGALERPAWAITFKLVTEATNA